MKNSKILLITTLTLGAGFLVGCETYHHGYGKATPGKVMQATGYNPASGKMHPNTFGGPGEGKGKGKGKKKGW